MSSSDLRTIIRIKHMAEAAANVSDKPGPEEGVEMAAAYDRLRAEAREVFDRAGWGDAEKFDSELPQLNRVSVKRESITYSADASGAEAYEAAASGRRARVLLLQLAAWAAGHQETSEVEDS